MSKCISCAKEYGEHDKSCFYKGLIGLPKNKNDIFHAGDVIEITGKNIKEKYRGRRGEIVRWHHDNIYTVKVFLTFSEIEIVLNANEMVLV